MEINARRAAIVARIQAETGIDDALISTLVQEFYRTARADDLLGPVFGAEVEDWDSHLGRMCEFWSSVALMSGQYHGQPMAKHLPLPIDGAHFDRWLELFEATCRRVCPPKAAEHFIVRARRIAESLELGIASQAGVMLGKGQRFRRASTATGKAKAVEA